MMTNTLRNLGPIRLVIGLTVNLAGLAIATSQYLSHHRIY
ncbi:hypothetical protein POAR111328_00455 [Polynucleobacter arcticus]